LKNSEPSAVNLLEEAVGLLRQTPPRAWAAFYGGTLPFLGAILIFGEDMANRGWAESNKATAAGLMVVLYLLLVWGQSWFAIEVLSLRSGFFPSWSRSRLADWLWLQAIVQPTSWVVLPLSAMAVIPFGWAYAFYHGLSLLPGSGGQGRLGPAFDTAYRECFRWPRQNHHLIWLSSPVVLAGSAALLLGSMHFAVWMGQSDDYLPAFALTVMGMVAILLGVLSAPVAGVVALNVGALLLTGPALARGVLGLEGGFHSGLFMDFNSTFCAVVLAITYAMLQPVVKAAYALRMFYGRSRASGEDLQAEVSALLHRLRKGKNRMAVLVLFVLLLFPCAGRAGDPAPAMTEKSLSAAIDETLSDRKYAWRLPGPRVEKTDEEAGKPAWVLFLLDWLEQFKAWVERVSKAIAKWVERWLEKQNHDPDAVWAAGTLEEWVRWAMFALIGLLVFALALWLRKAWKALPVEEPVPAQTPMPDVEDHGTMADALPADEWLVMAQRFLQLGEWRLCLRAFYLALLADLGHKKWVRIARNKSNWDYARELRRNCRDRPDLQDGFAEATRIYERSWYGCHPVNESVLQLFRLQMERIGRAHES
jgi:hypothetical protein